MAPAFVAALSSRILNTPLRLHQQIWPLQRISVGANLLRLAGTIPVLFAWPAAIGALLVNGVAEIFANRRLRRAAAPYADFAAAPDADAKTHIVAMVRRILPNAVYFSFSSQLGVFLVSFFGSAVAIAQIGALSRIGMALAQRVKLRNRCLAIKPDWPPTRVPRLLANFNRKASLADATRTKNHMRPGFIALG
jgi:hypothetical protein